MESEDESTSLRKRKKSSIMYSAIGKKTRLAQTDAERERLEKLVLGDATYMLRNLGVRDDDSGVEDAYVSDESTRQPAWKDEDDQGIRLDSGMSKESRRRKCFRKTFGQTSWAKLDRKVPKEDEDMATIRTAGNYIAKSSYIPKGIIHVKRLASLNNETRTEGPVIKCVEFHKKSTVALVAGHSGISSIFQVDGIGNNKLASIQFKNFPIKCGHFSTDGNEFIVGSHKHPFFYVYDMIEGTSRKIGPYHNTEQTNMKNFHVSPDGRLIAVAGRFGQIHLLSAASKENIGNLSQNNNVTTLTFSPNGDYLYSHNDVGDVYVWNMQTRSLVTKLTDDGTLEGSAMAASHDYLATGSPWGIVNIYERPEKIGSAPKPVKTFYNLVTSITSLKFNATQEILAMASDEKDGQIKMVHLPSMSAYSNFPSLNSNLGRVQTLDFSLSSGYFSCANANSTAFLYRLQHYGSY